MFLDGLEVFLDVYEMSWDSSKLKMAGGAHIYRPPSRTSRWQLSAQASELLVQMHRFFRSLCALN